MGRLINKRGVKERESGSIVTYLREMLPAMVVYVLCCYVCFGRNIWFRIVGFFLIIWILYYENALRREEGECAMRQFVMVYDDAKGYFIPYFVDYNTLKVEDVSDYEINKIMGYRCRADIDVSISTFLQNRGIFECSFFKIHFYPNKKHNRFEFIIDRDGKRNVFILEQKGINILCNGVMLMDSCFISSIDYAELVGDDIVFNLFIYRYDDNWEDDEVNYDCFIRCKVICKEDNLVFCSPDGEDMDIQYSSLT